MRQYKILPRYGFYLLSLLLFINFSSPLLGSKDKDKDKEQKDPKSSFKSTKLKEIKYFRDLSLGNYTIGYGYNEARTKIIPLAVYDKTFPNLADKKQLLKIFLASVGVGDLNLHNLVSKIKRKRLKKKKMVLEEHFLKNLLGDKKSKKQKLIFSKGFWRSSKIKWKAKCRGVVKESSSRIPLDCLAVKETSLGSKTAKRVRKILTHSLFDDDTWEEMQINSYFLKKEDGTYELIVSEEKKIPPTKIIDLRGYNSSYRKAVSWAVQTTAIKIGIGQIPFAVVPQIVVSILERFFNFIEVVHLFQHSEALCLIVEAKNGNTTSPFYGVLSQEELDHSIQYLKRASTFFSSILKNFFAKKEEISKKFLEKSEKKRKKNLRYLRKKDYEVTQLGQSYALGIKRDEDDEEDIDELKVFSLLKRKTLRRRPHTVVDFLNPYSEYFKRNILEAVLVASNFIYVAIPIIPTLFKTAFKEIAIREMQRYQGQEAGFRAYLDYNKEEVKGHLMKAGLSEEEANDHIESAYRIIKLRSLNPLVLTQKQREKRKWKSELWIKDRYPQYEPL